MTVKDPHVQDALMLTAPLSRKRGFFIRMVEQVHCQLKQRDAACGKVGDGGIEAPTQLMVAVCGCAAVYNTLLDICVRTKDDERGYEVIDRMCADRPMTFLIFSQLCSVLFLVCGFSQHSHHVRAQ